MMFPLNELIERHRMKIGGIVHCGAHLGQEADSYEACGVERVLWIDAIPELCERLNERVYPLGHTTVCACLGSRDGVEVSFNYADSADRSNLGQSSSVLPLGTHAKLYPDIKYIGAQTMTTQTLASLVEPNWPWDVRPNFLNMDLQGMATLSCDAVAERLRTDGLNLVGYLTRASGLGDVARRLLEATAQARLPHSTVATQRTASPTVDALAVDNRVEFTNTVCVVTADQFPFLATDFPELFAATQRMIGYWFWELEHVPLHMRQSIALVDEIWAGSRFVTDAFAAVSSVPVRHVPIPVPSPQPSGRSRHDFPLLADAGERPVFVTTLDHLSVTERKNHGAAPAGE